MRTSIGASHTARKYASVAGSSRSSATGAWTRTPAAPCAIAYSAWDLAVRASSALAPTMTGTSARRLVEDRAGGRLSLRVRQAGDLAGDDRIEQAVDAGRESIGHPSGQAAKIDPIAVVERGLRDRHHSAERVQVLHRGRGSGQDSRANRPRWRGHGRRAEFMAYHTMN